MALAYDEVSIRDAMLDLITARAGASALLRIYAGTRPATAGAEGTLLAELVMNSTFAPAASSGVLTLNAIADDASANATGTAEWFRIYKADGTTFVLDGDVGVAAEDLVLNSVAVVILGTVSVTSFTITEGNP